MRGILEVPKGLVYKADFIDKESEQHLLKFLHKLEFEPITMRGNTAKRTARHFGLRYNYGSRQLGEGEPIPHELESLIQKAEEFAELHKGAIVQALVNKYPYGATIGWHQDAPVYDSIIGISLGAPCIIQFQRNVDDERQIFERILNPRSAYIMRGEVRDLWQHHIPAIKSERYSITLRSLKG